MSTIANLVVQVSADSSKLTSELSAAEKQASSFGSSVTSAIGVTVAAFAAATAGAVGIYDAISNTSKEIEDLATSAQKFGTSVQTFQALAYAANQTNVSTDQLSNSLKLMEKNVGDAASGTGKAAASLTQLGLSSNQLKSLSPDKIFTTIATALSQVTDKTTQVSLGTAIFGRSFTSILPLIQSNVQQLEFQFEALGVGITNSQVEAAVAFEQTNKTLSTIFTGFLQNVASDVDPAFTDISKAVQDTIKQMGGIKIVALEVAAVVVGAAESMVAAFVVVSDTVKIVADEIKTAMSVGATVGQTVYDASHQGEAIKAVSSTGSKASPVSNFASQSAGIAQMNSVAGSNFTSDASATQMQKAADTFNTAVTTFGQGNKTLNDLFSKLDAQISLLTKQANASSNVANTGGTAGFASITDSTSGRMQTLGSPSQVVAPTSGFASISNSNRSSSIGTPATATPQSNSQPVQVIVSGDLQGLITAVVRDPGQQAAMDATIQNYMNNTASAQVN